MENLLVCLGTSAVYWLRRRWMDRISEGWPFANGTVEQRYIDPTGRGELAVISYSYSVEGDYYAGFSKQSFVLDGSAQRFIDRYPAGMKVLIRYRPNDPSTSVLRDADQLSLAHAATSP